MHQKLTQYMSICRVILIIILSTIVIHILAYYVFKNIIFKQKSLSFSERFSNSLNEIENDTRRYGSDTSTIYELLISYKNRLEELQGKRILLYARYKYFNKSFQKDAESYLVFAWLVDSPKADSVKIIQDNKEFIIKFPDDTKTLIHRAGNSRVITQYGIFDSDGFSLLKIPNEKNTKIVLMYKGKEISNRQAIDFIE